MEHAGDVHMTLPTGTPAYRVLVPDAPRGLVVIPDIGGVRPLFTDMCERLSAENGWSVITFEPWPGREHLTLEERMASVGTLVDDAVLADVAAAATVLEVEPVGVVGFCMGGMFALKAATLAQVHRAVSFYGMVRLPDHWRGPAMGDALDLITERGSCPILFIAAMDDSFVPNEEVDELEATGAEVVRYRGAQHGFVHDPTRDTHRADDAADAWRRAIAFFNSADQ
jgi:carboxymethylenebutenolidase